MASTYSTNLKIELIPTGAQSGIWGATTNTNLGTALEQAIVGLATCATADFVSNVATYTLSDSNASQTARAFCLNITATLTAAGTINVPAIQKPYLVFNNSVGGFAVTVKVSGQTGVSVPNGKKAWLYNNGTDVGVAMDYMPTLALGTALPTTSGGTGQASYTAGDLPYYASGTALSKLGIGANTYVLTSTGSAPQWVAPSTIPVGTATNIAGGTTGALPYQTGASTTTFLSIGTTNYVLTAGATAPQYVAQSTLTAGAATNLAGGAANRFPYQTGAGATTFLAAPTVAGSAILWDGSNLGWGLGPAASSASNLSGGGAYTVVYQSSAGNTAYVTNGTTGQAFIANTGAAPTWGTLGIAGGGTNSTATPTAGTVPYGTGTALAYTAVGTSGYYLQSNGAAAPTWTQITIPPSAAQGFVTQFNGGNTPPTTQSSGFGLI